MVAISRSIMPKHMMEMLLTGDMISAQDAYRFGLVNKLTAPDELCAETDMLARKIASKSSAVLAIGKQAFYRQLELPLGAAYEYCSDVMAENMMLQDAKEGIGAFIEKRSPEWEDC